jgi:hypothetical protein
MSAHTIRSIIFWTGFVDIAAIPVTAPWFVKADRFSQSLRNLFPFPNANGIAATYVAGAVPRSVGAVLPVARRERPQLRVLSPPGAGVVNLGRGSENPFCCDTRVGSDLQNERWFKLLP